MTRKRCLSMYLRRLASMATVAILAGPAHAAVDLRVESRPMAGPIEAFVRVTVGGEPVSGLERGDFAVTLDGQSGVTFTLGPPANEDTTQKTSIVFALATASSSIQPLVADFIKEMAVGDYAAIVRAKYMPGDPTPLLVVRPFTQIDGGSSTNSLIDFLTLSMWDLSQLRYGSMVDHTSVLSLALEQLEVPPATLPSGQKAIVLIGNGRYIGSRQSEVVARANYRRIPVFAIGAGDINVRPESAAFMAALAADTGGTYLAAPTSAQVEAAYETVASLLGTAYQLIIPRDAVTDCNSHTLEVTALGETAIIPFTRCDSTPENFQFTDAINVTPDTIVVSNVVTITGIESPVNVTVIDGEYSIGCGSGFTSVPGILLPEEEVCVRHKASVEPSTANSTTLIVGGVSTSFYSSTSIATGGGGIGGGGGSGGGDGSGSGSGGGGGATGVMELLLVLGAYFARIRWPNKRRIASPRCAVLVSARDYC